MVVYSTFPIGWFVNFSGKNGEILLQISPQNPKFHPKIRVFATENSCVSLKLDNMEMNSDICTENVKWNTCVVIDACGFSGVTPCGFSSCLQNYLL